MPKGGKRSGAGRPSTGRTEDVRLYLSPDAKAKLSAIAQFQKVPKGQIVEELLLSNKNKDVETLGKLIDDIVNANESLTIYALPILATKIQLACAYFDLARPELQRFDGKTSAYLDLITCFDRLQSKNQSLPLTSLSGEIDNLLWTIRDLEAFCGASNE